MFQFVKFGSVDLTIFAAVPWYKRSRYQRNIRPLFNIFFLWTCIARLGLLVIEHWITIYRLLEELYMLDERFFWLASILASELFTQLASRLNSLPLLVWTKRSNLQSFWARNLVIVSSTNNRSGALPSNEVVTVTFWSCKFLLRKSIPFS